MATINFDILIDSSLYDLTQDSSIGKNNNLLSEINNFESGEWRYSRFHEYIMNNIFLTTLSYEERQKIPNDSFTCFKKACQNLRILESDDNGKGSEIAEILLYAIMKDHFNALPAIPKIFYKENVNDYAKGADGVHIVLDENDFSLWYGEAKFYKNFGTTEFDTIAKSVLNSLNPKKVRKENELLTNLNDLRNILKDNPQKEKILNFLSDDTSLDDIKKKLHIPIMILYECPITTRTIEMSDEYKRSIIEDQINKSKKYFLKQNEICSKVFKYESVTFHLILFPVPNKTEIADKIWKTAKEFRGE